MRADRRNLALAGILLLACLLRLGYALQLGGVGPKDPDEYDAYAWSLAQGHGFARGSVVARRPPLFPFLLAGVYRVAGHSPTAARVLLVALGTALCVLVFVMARRLYGNEVALLAAAGAAAHPYLIYYCGYLMTETLAALLLSWLSLLWLRWSRDTALAGFFAGGVVAGLASLARPVFLALPAAFALWAALSGLGARRVVGATLAFTAGVAFLVLPWTARNYHLLGTLAPVQTGGGWQFYQYNLFYADPGFPTFEPERLDERAAAFRREHRELFARFRALPEAERDRVAIREALAHVAAHPADYARASLRKLWWFWRPSDFAVISGKIARLDRLFSVAIYLPLLALAAIGWWRLPPDLRRPFTVVVVYLSLMHSLFFHGTPRFRFPLYPHMIVLAAGAVAWIYDRVVGSEPEASA